MVIWRGIILIIGLMLIWQLIVSAFALPVYILPGPLVVLKTWFAQINVIASQTWPTVIETLLGLLLGIFSGVIAALSLIYFKPVRFWMMPVLIISQAIPTFAIAPLLVIWFGYGLASKIITTMLILFFPVTSSFYDGLRRVDSAWIELAKTMGASPWRILCWVRIPAALPAFASGVRVATAAAPIGAIIGEWVGSSRGLGFLMLNANARLQIDMMFAALFTIVLFALVLYFLVDKILNKLITWQA